MFTEIFDSLYQSIRKFYVNKNYQRTQSLTNHRFSQSKLRQNVKYRYRSTLLSSIELRVFVDGGIQFSFISSNKQSVFLVDLINFSTIIKATQRLKRVFIYLFRSVLTSPQASSLFPSSSSSTTRRWKPHYRLLL